MKNVATPKVLVGAFLLFPGAFVFGQGTLTPPGAPAPTMKTLSQVEARTIIDPGATGFTTPYTINQSGSYYLGGNINVSNGGNAIVIAVNNVTFDLNGFAISSTSNPSAGSGILLSGSAPTNVYIYNGTIHGQVTYSGSAFSGTGFSNGVSTSSLPISVRVVDVAVAGVSGSGIALQVDQCNVVERCTVTTANYGITAGTITSSRAFDVAFGGMYADTIFGCSVQMDSNAFVGIQGDQVQHCTVDARGGTGINGTVVSDSSGGSGGSNPAVSCNTAINTYGNSNSGVGITVTATATNCHGVSQTGDGMDVGISANTCYGETTSASAIGLSVNGPASYCGGKNSAGGTAIKASAGIGCATYGGSTNIPTANKFLGTP